MREHRLGQGRSAHGGLGLLECLPPAGLGDDLVSSRSAARRLWARWYAEADTPRGPWVYVARKIVTHDKYSFYNPSSSTRCSTRDGGRIYLLRGNVHNDVLR